MVKQCRKGVSLMAKQKQRTKEIELAIKYLNEVKKLNSKEISLELGVSEAIVDGVINEQPEESKDKPLLRRSIMLVL